MKKPDEIALWSLVVNGERPRDAGARLGIHPKRVRGLCEKWANAGIYDYGVCADLGWAEPGASLTPAPARPLVAPELWDMADLTPHIEALDQAAREVAANLDPASTRLLRIRTQIVAVDGDLGCMVACYNADTGELIGIGVDPPSPERRWGIP